MSLFQNYVRNSFNPWHAPESKHQCVDGFLYLKKKKKTMGAL